MELPPAFVADTLAREGPAGQAWLDRLPGLLADCRQRWGLVPAGGLLHGYVGVVLPVIRSGVPCALKVSWPDRYARHEADALEAWGGRGAVELLEADRDRCALLLERLDPKRSLRDLPPDEAASIAGGLIRRLAIEPPAWAVAIRPEHAEWSGSLATAWRRCGRPFGRQHLDRALALLDGLTTESANLLVNHDLHQGNVLAGRREPWLVIDPKIQTGDPEFSVAPLLWQPASKLDRRADLDRRLDLINQAGGLAPDRTRGWSFVRVFAYGVWATDAGLTEDPVRCAALLEWL